MFAACGEDARSGISTGQSAATTLSSVPATATVAFQADAGSEMALLGFLGDLGGGVSVVVERDGVVSSATAGVANSAGDPITMDTAFHMGSISKTVTTTLVMMLVDDGRVDLDAPLSTYLPEITVGATSTARSLLGHRSGIPSYTDHPEHLPAVLADLSRTWEPEEMLQYAGEVSGGVSEPFSYSNTNFVLLGMLLERLHGSDLNSILQFEIAEPLGLNDTVFAGRGVVTPLPLAAPFVPDHPQSGVAGTPYESIASSAFAGGGLVSTPSDLIAFLGALFGGDLLSEEGLGEMVAQQSDWYGLGIEIMDLDGGDAWFGHGGSIPGYRALMAIRPSTGEILVVAANNQMLEIPDFVRGYLRDR